MLLRLILLGVVIGSDLVESEGDVFLSNVLLAGRPSKDAFRESFKSDIPGFDKASSSSIDRPLSGKKNPIMRLKN